MKIGNRFEKWEERYRSETNETEKKLLEQKMIGFITALELAGKNVEANKCKQIFDKL